MLSLTKINSAANRARGARGGGNGYLFYIQSPSTRDRADFSEYLRRGEDAGQRASPFWAGDGARLLGLGDTPEPEHVERLAHGFHPLTGEPLVQGAGDRHVMGLDMTFSAPKDVSAVFAAANEQTQKAIISALQDATRAALRYAEAGALTRHGHAGKIQRPAEATLAACHTHFSSRSLDPQLHIHAFLLNVGKRAASTEWSALELRPQFERKLATGAIFRSELAWRVRSLGFDVVPDGPFFKIAGITDAQREALSTRSRAIKERAREQATSGNAQRDRDIAALNTRAGKSEPPLPELLSRFREQAASIGLTPAAVARMRSSPIAAFEIAGHTQAPLPVPPPSSLSPRSSPSSEPRPALSASAQSSVGEQAPAHFAIDHARLLGELTAEQSCFTPQEALAKLCSIAIGQWPADKCIAELDLFLESAGVVRLGTSERNMPVFSSQATVGLEARASERVRQGAANVRHRLAQALVESRFDALERQLSEKVGVPVSLAQQRAAALHVATRTGDHAFVEGWAGAGKTTLLKALGEAYAEAGFTLAGCAQSAAAAQNLSRETGIPSRTIASLLLALRNGRAKLSERTVLILDEAGMVGSREFAMLQEAAASAGAKLVAVGDSKQLQPIEAGGIFRALAAEHGAAEISSIQRQKTDFRPLFEWLDKQAARGAGILPSQVQTIRDLPEGERLLAIDALCKDTGDKRLLAAFARWQARFDHQWLRLAVEQFATGGALAALRLIDSRGRLALANGPDAALAATVEAWANDKTPLASKAMIAGTRAEVAELNALARARLVERGIVDDRAGADLLIEHRDGATETKRFAAGDRIVFTKNSRELGVANGIAGVVVGFVGHVSPAASAASAPTSARPPALPPALPSARSLAALPVEAFAPVAANSHSSAKPLSLADSGGSHGSGVALVVELDEPNPSGERRVIVPAAFARFDLAYCFTNHRSQGRTFDSSHVLLNPAMADREWAYVAASRSRFATTLYVDAESIGAFDPESHLASRETLTREQQVEALARGMSRSQAKGTTLDYRSTELGRFADVPTPGVEASNGAAGSGEADARQADASVKASSREPPEPAARHSGARRPNGHESNARKSSARDPNMPESEKPQAIEPRPSRRASAAVALIRAIREKLGRAAWPVFDEKKEPQR